MTSSSIVWFSVDRGNVAKALLGSQEASTRTREAANQLPSLASAEVAVGFTSSATDLLIPALAVVDKHHAEDLFAWLATYSPEVFPLSQYVRLLDSEEWAHAGLVAASTRIDADPIWPSLILGELLAQRSNPELRLTSIPLSQVPLCRSYTQARASALFRRNPETLRMAADRLELLDRAENHARNVSTGALRAIWALAEDAFHVDPFIQHLTRLLSWTFDRQRESKGPIPELPRELLAVSVDLRKLASGPLEYRVEEFERVASQLLAGSAAESDVSKARLPALFAALALWVGSGTSHISLLAEVSTMFPSTFAWFGAFAGVLGPSSWHSDWTRTNAAISKLLRGGFDIASTSTADLSWSEFSWLRSVGQFEMLASMPRASARILSVDVLPGAPAPFRLSGEDNHGSIHVESLKTDRAAKKQIAASPSGDYAGAVAKTTTVANDATLSKQEMTELLAAADTIAKLLQGVKDTLPPVSEESFELTPTPVGVKRPTSTARKSSKKPTSKKVSR